MTVVTTVGADKYVVAIVYAEVGYCGAVFVAVIDVGGKGCIGAYLVRPTCAVYVTP